MIIQPTNHRKTTKTTIETNRRFVDCNLCEESAGNLLLDVKQGGKLEARLSTANKCLHERKKPQSLPRAARKAIQKVPVLDIHDNSIQ